MQNKSIVFKQLLLPYIIILLQITIAYIKVHFINYAVRYLNIYYYFVLLNYIVTGFFFAMIIKCSFENLQYKLTFVISFINLIIILIILVIPHFVYFSYIAIPNFLYTGHLLLGVYLYLILSILKKNANSNI